MLYNRPLKCTGCSAEFPFPRGSFVYTDLAPSSKVCDVKGVVGSGIDPPMHYWDFPLLHQIWCLHCDQASYVERIPSAAEFGNAAGIRKLRDKRTRQEFDDDLLYLEDDKFREFHAFCVNRTSRPKCVLCGESSYVSIDAGKYETSLKHEQCWGSPIVAQGMQLGSWCGPPDAKIRFLSRDGELLWATTNTYKIYQYWLKAVFHVPATHPDYRTLRKAINAIVEDEMEDALSILSPFCANGDPSGLSMLGALHYIGKSVEHDGKRAVALLTAAMAHGDLAACHNLASLYCSGAPGVERDAVEGWKLFQQAREVGAQFELEEFYTTGRDDFYPHFRP